MSAQMAAKIINMAVKTVAQLEWILLINNASTKTYEPARVLIVVANVLKPCLASIILYRAGFELCKA